MTDKKTDVRIGGNVFGGIERARLRKKYEPDFRPRTGYDKI